MKVSIGFAKTIYLVLASAALLLPVKLYAQVASRKLSPSIFDVTRPIIFEDDFHADLLKWELSIDARDQPEQRPLSTPLVRFVRDRLRPGQNAVRFEVPGTPGSFRSEIALPAERAINERWYGERVMLDHLPADEHGYIVMQWHAVQGAPTPGIANFPNLAIWIRGNRWVVCRAFGSPIAVKRDERTLNKAPKAHVWTAFVLHVKWSKQDDGEIQLWQNGKLAWDVRGVNLYTDHATDVTPYLKTGIYRPSHRGATTTEPPTVVYVADVKIGSSAASYEMVAPSPSGPVTKP